MMKAVSRTATILFLAFMMAISLVPAFASASDPSAPAIYFAESIFAGRPVIVTGVGFTPSATITFTCGNQHAASSSESGCRRFFRRIHCPTHDQQFEADGSCAITATDGKTTAQTTLTVNEHDQDQKDPRRCSVTGNSADTRCCGPLRRIPQTLSAAEAHLA